MNQSELKKTSIHATHLALGAKMIPFGDWDMPIQYEGVLKEHQAVRNHSGIFDVSHMGEILIQGSEATAFLQHLTINDVSKLEAGNGQYTAMLNERGGFVDDLILYRLQDKKYLLCVNASNDKKDYDWLVKNSSRFEVDIEHASDQFGQIAVQGPESQAALAAILDRDNIQKLEKLSYMDIAEFEFLGKTSLIARTGYTGELGYELYLPEDIAEKTFARLAEVSKPIGLGARDTLRLEACYLLYGNDMNEGGSPIEAGIGWATKVESKDFIGKSVVLSHKEKDRPRKQLIAFTMEDKGIARNEMTVYLKDRKIGAVTSGGFLPTLEVAGGLALVDRGAVKIGDTVEIDIRGKRKLAKVARKPLYSAKVK